MPEVKQALLDRGYVPILIGGGITGDIQVNDTHIHCPLKANYRKLEMALMLEKLTENKDKIPAPDRDEMMFMLTEASDNLTVDNCKAFKNVFVTNKFDGSEDHFVNPKLYSLIGKQVDDFRQKLLLEETPKTLDALLKTITPPKG